MALNTGKFPTINTMQAALWVALGSKSTYELAPSRLFSEREMTLHLEHDFRLDEPAKDPPFLITFLCPELIRLPPPSFPPPPSDAKIQVAKRSIPTPTPKSGRENVAATVARLSFIDPRRVHLELRVQNGSLSSMKDWDVLIALVGSHLDPRFVRHVSKTRLTPHR